MKKDFVDLSAGERWGAWAFACLAVPFLASIALIPLFLSGVSDMVKLTIANLISLAGIVGYLIFARHKLNIFNFSKLTMKNIIIIVILSIVAAFAIGQIPELFNAEMKNEEILKNAFEGQSVILVLFSGSILAPILEEFTYRFFVLNLFGKKLIWLGYIVSSILFSVAHSVSDIGSFLTYFAMGLFFGGIYYKTKSIELAFLAHFINNFMAIAFNI